MSWNVVRLADVQTSPWRNGGGVTQELVAWPVGERWVWRMSVAQIDADGPFSRFDGVERWFAVLSGAGVRLDVDGNPHTLTAADAPFRFDGASVTHCSLQKGSTQDFNLMVRRGAGRSHMQRIQGQFGVALNAPKMIAVYALQTGATVQFDSEVTELAPDTLAWRNVPPCAPVQVDTANALWIEVDL
jgi:environmental stress-induced protein Ves